METDVLGRLLKVEGKGPKGKLKAIQQEFEK